MTPMTNLIGTILFPPGIASTFVVPCLTCLRG
jgi:hypothetical protein